MTGGQGRLDAEGTGLRQVLIGYCIGKGARTLALTAPRQVDEWEPVAERLVVGFHAGGVGEHVEQVLADGVGAVEVVVPEPYGSENDAADSLEFDAGNVIFEPAAVGESVHVGDELHVGGLVVGRIGEAEQEDGTVDKTAMTSMNDKCASGTGATIDKCMVKAGIAPDLLDRLVCPVGLPAITGKHPARVALSIAAGVAIWQQEMDESD